MEVTVNRVMGKVPLEFQTYWQPITVCIREAQIEGWVGNIGATSGGFSWGTQDDPQLSHWLYLDYNQDDGTITVSEGTSL